MKTKLWIFLIALGFAVLLASLLFIVVSPVGASDNHSRYLKLEGSFQFDYSDTLPYQVIRPMCWHDFYCDVPLDNVYRLYYVVDFDTELYSIVMKADAGCFVYTMRHNLGADNQPHLATVPEWVTCD